MLYKDLIKIYTDLESTSKRLEKTNILADFIKRIPDDDINKVILLLQGRIFPTWDDKDIGVASKLMAKAVSIASGISLANIEEDWKNSGDLGKTAHNLFLKKKQASLFSKDVTVDMVFDNLRKISTLEGHGSQDRKLQLISELLVHAKAEEAQFIVRTVLGDLRVGVGTGSIRDSIIWAFFSEDLNIKLKDNKIELDSEQRKTYNEYIEKVQLAYDLTNDFSVVIKALKNHGIKGLESITLKVGIPVNVMLFQKAKDIEDAINTVGSPAAFEFKYDGFRLGIHKDKKIVKLFTRRLEDVTAQFPEVIRFVTENVNAEKCILDAEAVGYDPDTGKYLAFQSISQRIKRKYDVEKVARHFPVEINVFDILLFEDKSLLDQPFKNRRNILEKIIVQKPKKIVLAKQIISKDVEEIESFYAQSLSEGEEGIMAKNLDAPYKPGSRVGYGVKVKPVMEPLDLVIVRAEYGEGKRSGWLTSFTLACWDEQKKNLLEIGKASTGLKELDDEGLSFNQVTELLKKDIKSSKGKVIEVNPKVIIEVNYEEIQKSPTYSSGYALRFPRVIRLRDEKPLKEINTLIDVKRLYNMQRGRGK